MTAHMGMFEVKDQVYGFMAFLGRWFGSEV